MIWHRFFFRLDDGITNSGSLIVSGKVELYSCKFWYFQNTKIKKTTGKKAKLDKILSKELKEKFRSPTRSEDIPFAKENLYKQQQQAVLSPTSPMSPFTPGFGNFFFFKFCHMKKKVVNI